MFTFLARLASTRPRRVLVATGVFFIVAALLGGPVSSMLNADGDSFSDTGAESAQALELIEHASGTKASPEVIALMKSDDSAALAATRAAMSKDPAVHAVVGGPDAGEPFVSRDGNQTYLAALYKAGTDSDEATERLRHKLGEIDGVMVGGEGVAYQAVNEQVEKDLVRAELLAFPLLFLAALWVFRSGVAALLPLLVGALTIVTSLMVVRGINEFLDISVFALNLIVGLGLGLAIDYSLFLVSRFREQLAAGQSTTQAVATTLATAGRTVAFSAVTVAGAGLALLVFPLRFLYSMGIGVTIVSLAAAAISLVVLPALFITLGERVNAWAPARWQRARLAESSAETMGFWYRWSTFVMRIPIGVAVAGAAILLTMGAPFLGIKFTGVDASVLPDSAQAKTVDTELRTHFEGADTSPLIVALTAPDAKASDVRAYAADLAALDDVKTVTPAQRLDDGTWHLDVVASAPTLDQKTIQLVHNVRDVDAPGTVLVGGVTAEQVDQVAAIKAGIAPALGILALLTVITLFLLTGSVILPIKALIMNVLTITATFGILVLIFQHGHLSGLLGFDPRGALESAQPVFIFAVVFGLSTDYAVFLLTRIKEARDGGASERESVALGLQRTGRIVTAAAVLFAIALGAFATSQIVFIKELGVGVALAVLIDATIVRAMLVPSLMALLGKWNWWAPRPLARIHDRFGISEGPATPANIR
jgi:uncharacterized membrane protein YdfJ with MMPL/SSD domain